MHVQLAAVKLLFGEFEFAGHETHAMAVVAACAVEYVDATQAMHGVDPVVFL